MSNQQTTIWKKAGNTAVITGGASGIGLAAAEAYVELGMHVMIADWNAETLEKAVKKLQELSAGRTKVLGQSCDIGNFDEVQILADRAFDEFGVIHCLMNNAGIGLRMGATWEDRDNLEETLRVNLWGVINGCQAFVPRMLASGQTGAIINTGSKQGITRPPGNYGYNISKAGVLLYTESLAHDFVTRDSCPLSAHLLIPGFVYTGITGLPTKPPSAWTPQQTIEFMLNSLDSGDFYILCPDNDVPRELDEKRIQWTADDMIKNRPALSRWHPDWKKQFADYIS